MVSGKLYAPAALPAGKNTVSID